MKASCNKRKIWYNPIKTGKEVHISKILVVFELLSSLILVILVK
jgi:hypothetical protein